MLFISSLEINNVVRFGKSEGCIEDQNIFLWIVAFVADVDAVNPNGIKTLLANGLRTFPIKGNLVFNNGLKILLKICPDCPISYNWVFNNFVLADESFAKALRILETCVLVNNNLCWKIFSSL